ncbi:MAG: Flp family type IVb pilin [Chloroflexi bacterium]|nr:Flp family type IVb pilin [Chloroflexota bacterium]MCZ7575712.1 Flp family type IVb pilin [Dehalococcoidia bacterium]
MKPPRSVRCPRSEQGQTVVEYALVLALVSVVVVAVLGTVSMAGMNSMASYISSGLAALGLS